LWHRCSIRLRSCASQRTVLGTYAVVDRELVSQADRA